MGGLEPEIPAGSRIGRYEVECPIGMGAMGTVYRARDTTLRRHVAIKLLRTRHLARADLRSRFDREARAVAAINHPNVVQIFDIDTYQHHPFFVMEYLDSLDVARLVSRHGRLDSAVSAAVGLAAAEGLAAAARAGVVHRDVKPANLVVTSRGEIKVTDFGLAKEVVPTATDNLTIQGATLGTPDYMSPEQVAGARVDFLSDVYSLGATLFHLLSGRPPFRQLSEDVGHMEVAARHVSRPVPRLDREPGLEVPPTLAELVAEMMAKAPASRPDYEEVISGLAPLANALQRPLLQEISAPRRAPPTAQPSTLPPGAPVRRGAAPVPAGAPAAAAVGAPEAPPEPPPEPPPGPPGARPDTRALSASSTALRIPGMVPRWALLLTVCSLLLFATTLTLYLVLPAAVAPPPVVADDAGLDKQRRRPPPPGFVRVLLPGGRTLLAARHVLDAEAAVAAVPRRRWRFRDRRARGLSYADAALLSSTLGCRLPTADEWPFLVSDGRIELEADSCEWVAAQRGQRRPRCFRRLAAERRASRAKRYADTVVRLVREEGED